MKKAKQKNKYPASASYSTQKITSQDNMPLSHIVAYMLCILLILFVVAKYIFGMEISFGNKPNFQSDLFNTGTTTENSSKKTFSFGSHTDVYEPVCGADGRTYGNSRIATLAKQAYTPGECKTREISGTEATPVLNENLSKNTTDALVCTAEYAPVCADDNHVYSNACVAQAAGATITGKGKCEDLITEEKPKDETTTPKSKDTEEIIKDKQEFSEDKFHLYDNARLKYGFAMPKYSYYQGYGAMNGADHTMAVGIDETGISTLENAPVQVYYFSKNNTQMPNGEKISLPNGNTVIIVTNQNDNPKIQKIADTIRESLH